MAPNLRDYSNDEDVRNLSRMSAHGEEYPGQYDSERENLADKGWDRREIEKLFGKWGDSECLD